MSRKNVEVVRRTYEAVNAAYRSGNVSDVVPLAEGVVDEQVVLKTTGRRLPEAGEWRGYDGVLHFIAQQMEAFDEMWIEPLDFIEGEGAIVVPIRFGGRARLSGIPIEFAVAHLVTIRDGKVVGIDVYLSEAEALEAVGPME